MKQRKKLTEAPLTSAQHQLMAKLFKDCGLVGCRTLAISFGMIDIGGSLLKPDLMILYRIDHHCPSITTIVSIRSTFYLGVRQDRCCSGMQVHATINMYSEDLRKKVFEAMRS